MGKALQDNGVSEIHRGGFSGLVDAYGGGRSILNSSWLRWSFGLSMIFTTILYFIVSENNTLLKLIIRLSEIGMSVEAGLIGLSLAGLTLVVTFGSELFMKTLIKSAIRDSLKKKKYLRSMYQRTTAKFGFAVLVQIITIVYLLSISIIAPLELEPIFGNAMAINFAIIFFAVLLLIYSLALVFQMTVNVFTLGQSNHAIFYTEIVDQMAKDGEFDVDNKNEASN